jgi:hypothetical protein
MDNSKDNGNRQIRDDRAWVEGEIRKRFVHLDTTAHPIAEWLLRLAIRRRLERAGIQQ